MLMRPHDGAVQYGVFVVGIIRQLLEYILPYARFSPATEPGVNGFPRTKTLRQIAPRYSRPVTIKHGFNEQAIVFGGDANRLLSSGQQPLNPFPLIIS